MKFLILTDLAGQDRFVNPYWVTDFFQAPKGTVVKNRNESYYIKESADELYKMLKEI